MKTTRVEERGKDEVPKPVKWLILFIVGPLIAGLALLAIMYISTFVSVKRAVDGYYTALEHRDYARAFDYVREDYMGSQQKEKVSVEEAKQRFVAGLQRLEAEEGYRVLAHSAEIGLNPWEGHWARVTLTIQDRHGKRKVFESIRTYGSGKRGGGRLMIYEGREPSDPYLRYRGEQVPLGSQEAGTYGSGGLVVSQDEPPLTASDVAFRLRTKGLMARPTGEKIQDLFQLGGTGEVISVEGLSVQVYRYPDPASAKKACKLTSGDLPVEWVAKPHFVCLGNLLITIVTDDEVLAQRIINAFR